MGCASLLLGILSLTGVLVSLIPFLNFVNCIALPFAVIGASLALLDLVRAKLPGEGRGMAAFGLVFNVIAIMIGMVRFLISLFTTGGIV
jgi:hypothetical protein